MSKPKKQIVIQEFTELRKSGKTNNELSKHYGITIKDVKSIITKLDLPKRAPASPGFELVEEQAEITNENQSLSSNQEGNINNQTTN